jgi:segregation and condensation protein B
LSESLELLDRQVEAILFVASDPVGEEEIAACLGVSPGAAARAVARLRRFYGEGRGLSLMPAAGGWLMTTAPDLADSVASFRNMGATRIRLSKAALETLAVIAYAQPATRSEIEEIRCVRCDRTVETLLRHGLIRVAGRKRTTGGPLLYRTTDRFLEQFGLPGLGELPSLEDLQEILPGEEALSEAEPEGSVEGD